MDLAAFRALSFDCYGTLIDWETGMASVLSPWAREQGLAATDEDLLRVYAENEAAVEVEYPTALYPTVLAELIILSNVHRAGFVASNRQLRGVFDAVITAEDVGAYKPAANHFRALDVTLAELGIARDALLHVAQSLFHDHVPARREGLSSVLINRRRDRPGWGATPPPTGPWSYDRVFHSMAEFADAVTRAFRR